MGDVVSVFASLAAFFSVAENVTTTIRGGYDFLVEVHLLEPRENVRNNLNSVRILAGLLKTILTTLGNLKEDLSGKVKAALVSLEYLDLILDKNRHDCVLREKQKIEEIYSELKTALNSIKLQVAKDSNNPRTIKHFEAQLKRLITIPQTKQQLKEIEAKIKEAVTKGIELTTLSTSVAVTKLLTIQKFNTSGTWPVTSNTTLPPTPPKLHVEELGNKFMLTWKNTDNDENIIFFELCYDEDHSLSMPILDGSTFEMEIGAPKVVPGRIYTMKIRGINEGGEGKWSDSVVAQFTKPTPAKPDPPELQMVDTTTVALMVAPPTQSHETESPVIEWNVQYVIDGHDREWRTENHKVTHGGGSCKFNVENLIPNQKYHFRVQAINAEGESAFSQPVSVKTKYIPSLDPPEIQAIGRSTAEIIVKWSQPVTELKLQYTCEPPKPITYKAALGEKMYSFVLEDLIPDKNYDIQVQAVHAGGYITNSPVVSFHTGCMHAPSFATLLSQLMLALSAMHIPLFLYYIVAPLLPCLIVCFKYVSILFL